MQNLQFLVLAGGHGQSLQPITEKHNKHLLPVANKPLIAYSIESIERYYGRDITILCNSTNYKQISRYFEQDYHKLSPDTQISCYYNEFDDILVDVITELYQNDKITKNLVIYSGDLISDQSLLDILDFHLIQKSWLTTVMYRKSKEKDSLKTFAQQTNIQIVNDSNFYILEEGTQRQINTLFYKNLLQTGGMEFKTVLLKNHPRINFESNLQECHLYFMNKDMCEIQVKHGKEWATFNEDFIQFIAKNQYNVNLLQLINDAKHKHTTKEVKLGESNEALDEDVDYLAEEINKYIAETVNDNLKEIPIFAYITDQYSRRVNSTIDYHQVNQDALGYKNDTVCYKPTDNNARPLQQIENTNQNTRLDSKSRDPIPYFKTHTVGVDGLNDNHIYKVTRSEKNVQVQVPLKNISSGKDISPLVSGNEVHIQDKNIPINQTDVNEAESQEEIASPEKRLRKKSGFGIEAQSLAKEV